MAFLQLLCTALKLNKLKKEVIEEKLDAIKVADKEKPKWRLRHIAVDIRVAVKRFFRRALSCFIFEKFCYKLRHDGSCENYTLKSFFGFISGFVLTYIFFMLCVFQLDFKLTTATIFCSVLGCILTNGLAFSSKVRCIVLLTLPQFFSQRGRQALLAYAFILAVSGPAKNTLNNMGILSESLACGQEQLKVAVRQILDAIKKPFLALKEAIKKLVKTVKQIVKKIKEILLTIKRIIMAIVRVIKAAFEFLAKIINICNKELGTPFERCSRVFENAIADCNAKLGPLFNWLCSIAYFIKSVCYLVKFMDLICMLVDFISNSIIGVVIRKVKSFIRHIKTMFYVRIKFSHSFQFHTNTSKTMAEVAHNIVGEIRDRTRLLVALFNFMTSAATLFFLFMIIKTTYYRFMFLTNEKFDNRFITKDFRNLDTRRAKLGKETVLPLNNREMAVYVSVDSRRLAKTEKKALSKAITTLASATLKLAIFIAVDYCLFWILNLINYYGRFQSKVQAPNIPTAHISGRGLLADLLRGIVKAFQPMGIQLEIDTVPCLPIPIPPNYDRYVQIATLLVLCWILTLLEPYGLRLRQMVMNYYHPIRAKERAIWLYNHIMRSRNSFLKFARRQLRRKVMGDKGIEKITCKEYLAANLKICRLCLGEGKQTACLLCGQVFRESEEKKPIRCQTPGCPGVYCEQCFSDLQNLCTICLSPIEYGDMSDISEERDSSDEEPKRFDTDKPKDKADYDSSSEEEIKTTLLGEETESEGSKKKDSDYYSSEDSTDYSYSYQYDESAEPQPIPPPTTFRDVEKQEIPEYVSMESFREDPNKMDVTTTSPSRVDAGTIISGTTFGESRKLRHINFIGIPCSSSDSSDFSPRRKPKKVGEHTNLLTDPKLCFCSDSSDSDVVGDETPLIALSKSTTSTTTQHLGSFHSTSGEAEDESPQPGDLDPEVKDDLRYIQMLIPELDLSALTESEPTTSKRSFAEEQFSNVTYEVVSESPRSTDSIRYLSSSTNISPLRDIFVNVPEEHLPIPEEKVERNIPAQKNGTSQEKPKVELQASGSVDNYNLVNSQRKRVKQYYKAVKDIPTNREEVKRKQSRFARFVQKLLPKRRKNPDELPLYSKSKEVIELKSYNYRDDQWDTLSTGLSSSAYVGQETSESPRNLTSSSEEDENEGRVRGGTSGLIRNPLTSRNKKGYIQLKKLPHPAQPTLPITTDLLSKYFVSIEDLTPTRDCGPMSTAKILQPISSYETGDILIREVPEKDKPRTSVASATNTPATSTSSILSESFCKAILGRPCKAFRKKKTSSESVQSDDRQSVRVDTLFVNRGSITESNVPEKKLSDIVSESAILAEREIEVPQNSSSGTVKPNSSYLSNVNLLETVETEVVTTEVTNQEQKRSSVSSQANVARDRSRNLSPTVQENNAEARNSLMNDFPRYKGDVTTKDQKLQTFPIPILKFKSPSEKSIITIKEGAVPSQISQPLLIEGVPKSDINMMDSPEQNRPNQKRVETQYPVKETSYNGHNREKILLTSDKMQQTSDDDISKRATATVGVCYGGTCYATDSARPRTSSLSNNRPSRPSSFLETIDNVQQTSSSTCICGCLCSETTEGNQTCGYCLRPPPPPPQYECPNLKEKCYRSAPTQETRAPCKDRHYKCPRSTPSEHTVRSKSHRKVYRDVPTDDEAFSFCGSQRKRREGHLSEHSRRACPAEPEQPRRRRSKGRASCSCTGDCECCVRMHKPRQSSSPPRRYCPVEYNTSSSDLSDPTDDDDYYSDCPPNRFDLPYQNNDDYLELVQELEETLQSRNRNRVRRAMQEFEQRSKYNKPLEQPIINYDETSESEEPIIEKISKLTSERKGCCGGEMCSCRRKASRHCGRSSKSKRGQRPRSGDYVCATMCRQIPESTLVKTHWQLDKNSGEWFKVSEHPQRRRSGRRSKTPSPQRGYCPYNCSCCGTRHYDFR